MKTLVLPLALCLAVPALATQTYHAPVEAAGISPPGRVIVLPSPAGQGAREQAEQHPAKQAEKTQPKVWLGLALRERQDGPRRLEVDEVFPDSPAAAVGIRVGDKLVAVDGRTTARHTDVLDALQGHKIGDRVSVTVERSLELSLGRSDEGENQPFLGVSPRSSEDHGADWMQGVGIASTIDGSAAKQTGLQVGDRICALDGVEVRSFEQLRKAVLSKQPGDRVELRIQVDSKPSLAARRTPQGERSPQPSKESPRIEVPPPPQPPPGVARGWSWDRGPESGAQLAPAPLPPQAQATPRGPQPGRAGGLGRPGQPAPDNAQELRGLLDELRGLRQELAELRKELEVLRAKQQR